jgi:hypothetical protein
MIFGVSFGIFGGSKMVFGVLKMIFETPKATKQTPKILFQTPKNTNQGPKNIFETPIFIFETPKMRKKSHPVAYGTPVNPALVVGDEWFTSVRNLDGTTAHRVRQSARGSGTWWACPPLALTGASSFGAVLLELPLRDGPA